MIVEHHRGSAGELHGPDVRGAVLCSGVYDLEAHYDHESKRRVNDISALGGAFPRSAMRRNSPVVHVVPHANPPRRVLVVHGDDDATAPLSAATAFCDALEARRLDVDVKVVEDGGHLDYAFRAMYDDDAPFLTWMDHFINSSDDAPEADSTRTSSLS